MTHHLNPHSQILILPRNHHFIFYPLVLNYFDLCFKPKNVSKKKLFFNILETPKTKIEEMKVDHKFKEIESVNSPLLSEKQSFPFTKGVLNNCEPFEISNDTKQKIHMKKKGIFNDAQNFDFMKTETTCNEFFTTESKNMNGSLFVFGSDAIRDFIHI